MTILTPEASNIFSAGKMFLSVEPVDEMHNKDKKVNNLLSAVKLLADPAVRQDPLSLKILGDAFSDVGITIKQSDLQPAQAQAQPAPGQALNKAELQTDEE